MSLWRQDLPVGRSIAPRVDTHARHHGCLRLLARVDQGPTLIEPPWKGKIFCIGRLVGSLKMISVSSEGTRLAQ